MDKEPINVEKTIDKDNDHKQTKKTSKVFFIIVSAILIVLLLTGSFVLGRKFAEYEDNKTEEKQDKKPEKETPEEEKYDKEKYKNSIYLYKSSTGLYCETETNYCKEKSIKVPTITEDAGIVEYTLSNDNEPLYILYRDETYKIYNVKEDTIIETPIKIYDYVQIHVSKSNDKVYGITYMNNSQKKASGYYNLETQTEIYKNKYDSIYAVADNYLSGYNENEEEDYEDDENFLLNKNEEKEELSTKGICKYYEVNSTKNGDFYIELSGCIGEDTATIYNKNKKVIAEEKDPTQYAFDDDGYLHLVSNNKVEKYNVKGELLSTSKSYSNILDVIKHCILYVENNEIYITDGKEATKLGPWNEKTYYHSMISGYYDEGSLANENEKDAGIYLIFEEEAFNDGPGIEYYYNIETREVREYELEYIGGYAKPVLYLYPEKETDITVNFEKEDNLTTTYPKFKEEWQVTAHPNGDLYDKDGKYYYALYWEESSNHKVDFKEGFYVTKDNAIKFLEEKLSIIGLNAKERNEFIMYWLPIIESNEHNLIYFELTEERESFNKLEITPTPDSLLRVAIHVKKIDEKQTIKEQKLPTFQRTGFTAVEWGGVLYK